MKDEPFTVTLIVMGAIAVAAILGASAVFVTEALAKCPS